MTPGYIVSNNLKINSSQGRPSQILLRRPAEKAELCRDVNIKSLYSTAHKPSYKYKTCHSLYKKLFYIILQEWEINMAQGVI